MISRNEVLHNFNALYLCKTNKKEEVKNMNWKYVKREGNPEDLFSFERLYHFSFPEDFEEYSIAHDGDCPDKKSFKTVNDNTGVLKLFLSFDHDKKENAWNTYKQNKSFLNNKYVPFAVDINGNLICFKRKNSKIVVVNRKTSEAEKVSDSFSEFFNSLY